MSEVTFEKNLIALAGRDNWALGTKLYREGAILDLRKTARSFESRVANDRGGFERVKLSIRRDRVSSACTCAKHAAFCEHAVAGLLLIAEENPDLISFLKEPDYLSESRADSEYPLPPRVPAPSPAVRPTFRSKPDATVEALRFLLRESRPQVGLRLQYDGTLPTMESHWNRLSFGAILHYRGRRYAAGNIRRLVESGHAAGHMSLTDFAPRDQQVMRFLMQHTQFGGSTFQADAFVLSDLFHCLVGSDVFRTARGPVLLHRERLTPILGISRAGGTPVVHPRLRVEDHGTLPDARPGYIAGRGGYWVGFENEYWWLPGIFPLPWLLLFLRGRPFDMQPTEEARLTELIANGTIPAEIVSEEETAEIAAAKPGTCRPVLTLDWRHHDITATLEFAYGNKKIAPGEPLLVWGRQRYVTRNDEAEAEAAKALTGLGFEAFGKKPGRFAMKQSDRIWDFARTGPEELGEEWEIYWTPSFARKREASGELRIDITGGEEGDSWFETRCELHAGGGVKVDWGLVSEAIHRGDEYVALENGIRVRLPGDVLRVIRLLLRRADVRADDTFRFGRYAAIPLAEAVDPYWQGTPRAWRKLRESLLSPDLVGEVPLPRDLRDKLRDYQVDGVRWIELLRTCDFHGILADEMGLGKTIQGLAVISGRKLANPEAPPTMIVCPTSLLENWLVEAGRFVPWLKAVVVRGSDRHDLISRIPDFDIIITSYALLRRDIVEYEAFEFDYVILDEAQHIKNPRTANARTCKELRAANRLILTGTPVENSLSEVWSLFDFLLPGYLGSHREFRQEYEQPAANGHSQQVLADLASHIHPFILRRTKQQVCDELPAKLEQVMYCEFGPEQRRLYDTILAAGRQMLQQARSEGWQKHRFELLSILLRLRQICCHPELLPADFREGVPEPIASVKMDLAQEVILEAIDSGHRILFFSQFTSVLKRMPSWLDENGIRYEYLDGSTKDRQNRVDRFNGDSGIPIFLLSLKAGGTGLNLTGADTVIHYDQWWNPMVEDQATDRTHRIGQTRPVTAMKLICRHTIEEKILDLQASKRDLFRNLVAGAPARLGELTEEDVEFLLGRN